MADYRQLYLKMFNASTDADRLLEAAARLLKTAQAECEELFTQADDTPLTRNRQIPPPIYKNSRQ